MAAFGHAFSQPRDSLGAALPRLYKFATILTANEQLARALVRGACRSLGAGREGRASDRDKDHLLDGFRRMYTLWSAKLAEDPSLAQKNAPDVRLFAGSAPKASPAGNTHFAKFIANLPAQQRCVLYLVYGEGLAYDEAAEIMSLNMLALMKLLSRGHLALAHWLDHRGLTEDSFEPPLSQQPDSSPDGERERAA